jgi:hypothetical protein
MTDAGREIIAIPCFHCDGTGSVDWREAKRDPGFVTAEVRGVTTTPCPHCNGCGDVPAFRFPSGDIHPN